MPVILATQKTKIRRIMVWSQPVQIVQENLSQKTLHKYMASRVAWGKGPEFKISTTHTNKNPTCSKSFSQNQSTSMGSESLMLFESQDPKEFIFFGNPTLTSLDDTHNSSLCFRNGGREDNGMMERVNSILVYCKNFCKCYNVPPVQQ
jgi:hypothetical protein